MLSAVEGRIERPSYNYSKLSDIACCFFVVDICTNSTEQRYWAVACFVPTLNCPAFHSVESGLLFLAYPGSPLPSFLPEIFASPPSCLLGHHSHLSCPLSVSLCLLPLPQFTLIAQRQLWKPHKNSYESPLKHILKSFSKIAFQYFQKLFLSPFYRTQVSLGSKLWVMM